MGRQEGRILILSGLRCFNRQRLIIAVPLCAFVQCLAFERGNRFYQRELFLLLHLQPLTSTEDLPLYSKTYVVTSLSSSRRISPQGRSLRRKTSRHFRWAQPRLLPFDVDPLRLPGTHCRREVPAHRIVECKREGMPLLGGHAPVCSHPLAHRLVARPGRVDRCVGARARAAAAANPW